MFSIKVCGITTVDDAQLAARAGADAVGLNFYPRSKRFVTLDVARAIIDSLPPGVAAVGVFVNSLANEVCDCCDQLALDYIQLHGDEPPEYLAELGERRVVRALRLGPNGLGPLVEYLDRAAELGRLPAAVLVDAFAPHDYGGTGQRADWSQLVPPRPWLRGAPLVLAGGLRPDNVAAAIGIVQPTGVDVASGVESAAAPRKHPALVNDFVAVARRTFTAVKPQS